MFEPKTTDKLYPTDAALYDNKLRLEEFRSFNPFRFKDLNGLKVLAYPEFEPYYKVIKSLRVVDDEGKFLKSQTDGLRNDVVSAAKNGAYLELLYLKHLPEENSWRTLLEEKLLLELVNLVLDDELPTDTTLSNEQIATAQKTFQTMLNNAS